MSFLGVAAHMGNGIAWELAAPYLVVGVLALIVGGPLILLSVKFGYRRNS